MSLKIGVDVDGTLTFPSLPKILSTILSVVSFFLPPANKELISYLKWVEKRGGKIIVISSRPKLLRRITIWWLKKYKIPHDEVFCEGRKKIERISTENLNIFFDNNKKLLKKIPNKEGFILKII